MQSVSNSKHGSPDFPPFDDDFPDFADFPDFDDFPDFPDFASPHIQREGIIKQMITVKDKDFMFSVYI